MVSRWNGFVDLITPRQPLRGLTGHVWEQVVLPRRLNGRLLFSPSNTGPLAVKNQVVTMHDMAVFDCESSFSPSFRNWYKVLLPQLARRVRRIITVSQFVKEQLLSHIAVDSEKVVVIHNGVSDRFRPVPTSTSDNLMPMLNLPCSTYVLAVGSSDPRKNLPRLLHAWNRIEKKLSEEIWLVIAGVSSNPRVFHKMELENLPKRVFFTGHVDDKLIPTLFARALAMVYVSLYEGFGLPPLEAMASGTPVLAGNRTSLPEILGEAALLVDPLDVEAIADGLTQICQNASMRSNLEVRGLARAAQFSWDIAARKTWQVLQNSTGWN